MNEIKLIVSMQERVTMPLRDLEQACGITERNPSFDACLGATLNGKTIVSLSFGSGEVTAYLN